MSGVGGGSAESRYGAEAGFWYCVEDGKGMVRGFGLE